jgi:protein O-GlcNAc transferase
MAIRLRLVLFPVTTMDRTGNPPTDELNGVIALYSQGRVVDAVALADRLLMDYPNGEILHNITGAMKAALGRFDAAIAHYDAAIALADDYEEAYNNRGNAWKDCRNLEKALADYEIAILLQPGYADAYTNRGIVLRGLNRRDAALASYDRAIELNPNSAQAYNNRANLLLDMKRLDEAAADYEKAIQLKPDYVTALSQLLFLRARLCDWAGLDRVADLAAYALAGAAVQPFCLLRFDDNAQRQLRYSQGWAKTFNRKPLPAAFASRPSDAKIRVGYFSADFHNHATMYLMARMFELHDKNSFEIHAFSYGRKADGDMRQRLFDAADAFHDVADCGDQAIAELARDKGIDIAVDLKGYTENARTGIFAHRAAPHQLAYLGYPGTMGAEFIDLIVADRVVIPDESRGSYSEKIAYLPNCYQVNDDRRAISDNPPRRSELGLPEAGFVFCAFNNNYKISPAEFDIWMRLLTKVEGSVLWLVEDNPWATANLRRYAQAKGVDPGRLVFANWASQADHLARHCHADLFLDTFNVNAHTTASDALWAGLPVVTRLGESFAARVAGSLLHAIGMPELVTETAEAYEQLALELATDPARLAAIKTKLAANRSTTPLFDSQQFTRDIEQVYTKIVAGSLA